jgi:hypothetical protein
MFSTRTRFLAALFLRLLDSWTSGRLAVWTYCGELHVGITGNKVVDHDGVIRPTTIGQDKRYAFNFDYMLTKNGSVKILRRNALILNAGGDSQPLHRIDDVEAADQECYQKEFKYFTPTTLPLTAEFMKYVVEDLTQMKHANSNELNRIRRLRDNRYLVDDINEFIKAAKIYIDRYSESDK